MRNILIVSAILMMMANSSFANSGKEKYVVKGGVCTDGSWFNAAESIPVGAVLELGTIEEVKKAVNSSKGELFFFRGDERNLFIKFKSGKNFEYASGRAPCDNESWSLISLEKLEK